MPGDRRSGRGLDLPSTDSANRVGEGTGGGGGGGSSPELTVDSKSSLGEVVSLALDLLDARREQERSQWGVPTGMGGPDEPFGQLPRGGLSLVVGDPGVGRTTLALSVALNAALVGRQRVSFYSLEHTFMVLGTLLLARSGIEPARLGRGQVTGRERRRLSVLQRALSGANMTVDDRILSFEELEVSLRHDLRGVHGDFEAAPDLVVIDGLQHAGVTFDGLGRGLWSLGHLCRRYRAGVLATVSPMPGLLVGGGDEGARPGQLAPACDLLVQLRSDHDDDPSQVRYLDVVRNHNGPAGGRLNLWLSPEKVRVLEELDDPDPPRRAPLENNEADSTAPPVRYPDRAARPDDFRTRGITEPHLLSLVPDRLYSGGEWKQISHGFVPAEMEDHWFAYVVGQELYLHRSWTGYCIYRVKFQEVAGSYLMTTAWVTHDSHRYAYKDDLAEAVELQTLIGWLLLGNSSSADEGQHDAPRPWGV